MWDLFFFLFLKASMAEESIKYEYKYKNTNQMSGVDGQHVFWMVQRTKWWVKLPILNYFRKGEQ